MSPIDGPRGRSTLLLRALLVVVICACAPTLVVAQTASTGAAGYISPYAPLLAPGQLVTLFVSGLKGPLPAFVSASTIPLPYSLAGISITARQPAASANSIPVPLYSLERLTDHQAAIIVQIPLELVPTTTWPPAPGAMRPTIAGPAPAAVLTVSENGAEGDPIGIAIVPDQSRVVSLCDTTLPASMRQSPIRDLGNGSMMYSSSCDPLVVHADGTIVTPSSPARPEEVVVIYAYGLGATVPPVPSGQVSPVPAAVVPSTRVSFTYYRNDPASLTVSLGEPPLFAGLTPGLVGLYQVNVRIPPAPADLRACSTYGGNVEIMVRGAASTGFANICVKP